MADAIGAVLGERYRLDAPLGQGGMGTLWRAHDLVLHRDVAVKTLDPAWVGEPEVAERFDREAHAVSQLDHPNCVQVYDAGTTHEGGKYIVMQLLAGVELRELLRAGALALPRALGFATQILRGLDHAHRRGLVHRDLKPENIFVVHDDDGNEQLKLVDFGIVKVLGEGTPKLTRAGQVFGTPRYMSPEQISGGTIDARTDLYAVGVLLFEMLTGHAPFEADHAGMVMRMHVITDPPPLPATVPSGVREVVARLLQKRAADRYATAREVIDALAKPAAPADDVTWIIPPRDVLPSRPSSVLSRPPNLALRAVAMVLLVVLVVIAALLFNSWRDGR